MQSIEFLFNSQLCLVIYLLGVLPKNTGVICNIDKPGMGLLTKTKIVKQNVPQSFNFATNHSAVFKEYVWERGMLKYIRQ